MLIAARAYEDRDTLMRGDWREQAVRIKQDIADEVIGAKFRISTSFPNQTNDDIQTFADHLAIIAAKMQQQLEGIGWTVFQFRIER